MVQWLLQRLHSKLPDAFRLHTLAEVAEELAVESAWGGAGLSVSDVQALLISLGLNEEQPLSARFIGLALLAADGQLLGGAHAGQEPALLLPPQRQRLVTADGLLGGGSAAAAGSGAAATASKLLLKPSVPVLAVALPRSPRLDGSLQPGLYSSTHPSTSSLRSWQADAMQLPASAEHLHTDGSQAPGRTSAALAGSPCGSSEQHLPLHSPRPRQPRNSRDGAGAPVSPGCGGVGDMDPSPRSSAAAELADGEAALGVRAAAAAVLRSVSVTPRGDDGCGGLVQRIGSGRAPGAAAGEWLGMQAGAPRRSLVRPPCGGRSLRCCASGGLR